METIGERNERPRLRITPRWQKIAGVGVLAATLAACNGASTSGEGGATASASRAETSPQPITVDCRIMPGKNGTDRLEPAPQNLNTARIAERLGTDPNARYVYGPVECNREVGQVAIGSGAATAEVAGYAAKCLVIGFGGDGDPNASLPSASDRLLVVCPDNAPAATPAAAQTT